MGDRFYTRLGGRVRGPFTMDGLKEQNQKGVFSILITEVSEDRINWMRASEVPALNELMCPSVTTQQPIDNHDATERQSVQWHYTQHGVEARSIVSAEQLDLLIRQGTIALDEKVWNETMPDWVEVSQSQFVQGRQGVNDQQISILTIASATLGIIGYLVLMYCTIMLVLEMKRRHFAASENVTVVVITAIDFLVGIAAIVLGHLAISNFRRSNVNNKEHRWIVVGLSGGYAILIVAALLGIAASVSASGSDSSTAYIETSFYRTG